MSVTVACVLRSGGRYTPEWVYALKRGLNRHLPDHTFACLTEMAGIPPVWARPLEHRFPGWWSKMNLFRPGLFDGPVLYLDLDTDVVGSLDWFDYTGPLALVSDFYRPRLGQSGVMAFTPGPVTEALWEAFTTNPEAQMQHYVGDGQWLHRHAPDADRLQDLYPGKIVSHKVHCGDGVPDGASIVCFHGEPKRYPDGTIRSTA